MRCVAGARPAAAVGVAAAAAVMGDLTPMLAEVDGQFEQENENLRRDYEHAVEAVESTQHEVAQTLLSGVVGRLGKSKWVAALGDAGATALEDIRAAIVFEQQEGSTRTASKVRELRTSVDRFSDGMSKQLRSVQRYIHESNKDALRNQRAASFKEVEQALAKQGYEHKVATKEMQERYEAELAAMRAKLAEMEEKYQVQIEGLKLAIRKKDEEMRELRAVHENLQAEFETLDAEASKMRTLCRDQEEEIAELRLQLTELQGLRDDYDLMVAEINAKVGKILEEVRKAVRRVDEHVAQPAHTMERLPGLGQSAVLQAMHDAITSLLTEREEHLSRIETLQAKVDGASAQHELEMRDLRKKIKELQDEIDVLRNGSASKIADLRDRIAELEARVAQLLDDKRALAVALESQVGARFIQCRRAGEGVRGRMCFGVCLCWRSARAERAR